MTQSDPNSTFDEIRVKGSQLVDRVKEVIEEGTARRITIMKDDKVVMELPMVVGFGGATAAVLLAPVLAAVGAFAALASDVRVIIERPTKVVDVEPETEDSAA